MESEGKVQYGPRKLGQKKWAEQQSKAKATKRQATVYGERKMGRRNVASATASAAEAAKGGVEGNPFLDAQGGRVSIAKLEELIHDDPILLDVAIETELAFGKDARKGAIAALRKIEGVRAGGPRSSVTALLDQLEQRVQG